MTARRPSISLIAFVWMPVFASVAANCDGEGSAGEGDFDVDSDADTDTDSDADTDPCALVESIPHSEQ